MEYKNLKKDLEYLKMYVDSLEQWIINTQNLIYTIEEKIIDKEEQEIYLKMNEVINGSY